MLIVSLEGLCALQFSPHLNVLLPGGHRGAEHISALVGAADQILIKETDWKPDIMFTVPELGTFLHVWYLADQVVDFGDAGATTWDPDAHRALVIDFKKKHPHAKAKVEPSHSKGGKLQFGRGRLAAVQASVHQVEWVRKGTVEHSEPIAERFEWTGGTIRVSSAQKGAIVFDPKLTDVRLAVANTRPGDAGLTHFHAYYELLQDFGDQFELRYAANQPTVLGPFDPIAGNCVPPGCIPGS